MDTLIARVVFFSVIGFGALIILKRPAVAMGILLCTYVLEQWVQTQDTFFVANSSFTNIAVGLLIVMAVIIRAFQREQVFKPYPPAGFAVLGILFYATITAIWSPYDDVAGRLYGQYRYFIAFGLLMPLVVSKFEDLHATAMTLLFLGTSLVTLMITTSDWDGRGLALAGNVAYGAGQVREIGSPLAVAGLAGSVAMIVVLLNFRGIGRVWQIARWGVVIMAFYVALKSNSRGQVLAMLIAGLTFIAYSRRIGSWKGLFGSVFAVCVFALVSAFLLEAMVGGTERWSPQRMVTVYGSTRLSMAGDLLQAWLEAGPLAWVFGLGIAASFDPTINGVYPHLVMAEALGELGLIGFVLLWLVVIFAGRSLYRLWPAVKDYPEARGLVAVIGALFFFNVILSFKQGSLLDSHSTFAFAIILGRLEMNYAPKPAASALPADASTPIYDGPFLPEVALPNLSR